MNRDLDRTPTSPSIEAAWRALGTLYDPELGLDVVSLGLVYGISEDNGSIAVKMTLTTPGCPAAESFPEMAQQAVEKALGNSVPVEIHVVWDPPWSPELVNDQAASALGFRRK